MTYLVRLELKDGRAAGSDVVQVTGASPEDALAAARGMVMPGVEVTLEKEAEA